MGTITFFAVLLAAFLHAGWNALVKGGRDKQLNMAAIVIGHMPFALACLAFVPAPDPASYPYLLAGAALHFGYQLVLLNAYRIGDLSQVYPIARGAAPMIVALVSIYYLGIDLPPLAIGAICLIALAISSLSLVRVGEGQGNRKAAALALLTGTLIAGYSLVDGTGARLAGTAIGFYSWLTLINGTAFLIFLAIRTPKLLPALPRAHTTFWLGGGASFAAYALVIWSFTQAPIAMVTALRETSIIFALILGVVVLKERLNLLKVAATMATIIGVGLLRLAKT